jgi:hypothetical protein
MQETITYTKSVKDQVLNWLLRLMVLVGVASVWTAIWAHPSVADDWYVLWILEDSGSAWAFIQHMYQSWTGRILNMALASLVLENPIATNIFRLTILPCFLLLGACVHYLATGNAPRFDKPESRGFLLTTALLWLGIPVPSETVVQTTGAIAYLFPTTFGLGFLTLFRCMRDRSQLGKVSSAGYPTCIVWLFTGIVVGTSNEQLVVGIVFLLTCWGLMLWRDKKLINLPFETWCGFIGLIIGAIILILAPGNYVRMGLLTEGSDRPLTILARFCMYLGGAYFGLGTGDTGKGLWLGLSVLLLSGIPNLSGKRGKDTLLFLTASVVTLIPMILLVNFAAPRTTFFAVVFLLMATVALTNENLDPSKVNSIRLVSTVIAFLIAIDGFVGWAANRNLSIEVAERLALIRKSAYEGRKEVEVPYLTTIPSRLTFMLNPAQDKAFVDQMSKRQGLSGGRHDDSPQSPRPLTVNPLKKLKNLL